MSGLDSLLLGNAEAIEALSIEERVKIPGGLPHELSIEDIAKLAAPNNQEKQELLIKTIVDLCKSGVLNYYGDINGWSHYENMLNPFPKAKTHSFQIIFWDDRDKRYASSRDCLIHRDNFKVYLQHEKQWPVSGLLANWWPDEQPQAEALANGDDTPKPVKRLIEKERNTTELLDLIYQMFDAFDIKPGDKIDKLTAHAAWGHILAKKYKNDLIKTITGERKAATIELNGGDQVDFETFSRTYNRRFK